MPGPEPGVGNTTGNKTAWTHALMGLTSNVGGGKCTDQYIPRMSGMEEKQSAVQ